MPGASQAHRPDVRGIARDAVGVADRHQAHRRVLRGDVLMSVAEALAGRNPFGDGKIGAQRHRRRQPEGLRVAQRRNRRQAVDGQPRSDQVEGRAGIGQRGRGVGDVPDLEVAPCAFGVTHGLPESFQLAPHRRVRRLVRVDEVGPHADDPDNTLGLQASGSREQDLPVVAERAVAAEPGVDLEVDAGRAPQGAGRIGDLGQGPQRRHGQVDVGGDGGREVRTGNMQPGQDRHVDSAVPQRHRLTQLGDSEPRRTATDGSTGAGHQTVPVAVGLDDSHHGGRSGVFAQNLDIAADRVQIHGGTRGLTTGGRCHGACSQPMNLVRHGKSLSGSSGPASQ